MAYLYVLKIPIVFHALKPGISRRQKKKMCAKCINASPDDFVCDGLSEGFKSEIAKIKTVKAKTESKKYGINN